MITFSLFFFFLRIRRPPRSTQSRSSAASDVYKRQADRPRNGPPAAAERDLQDGPLFDSVGTIEEPRQTILELVRFHLGEEAEPAEVDTKQGNASRGGDASASEKRAVTAKRHDKGRVLETGDDRVHCIVTLSFPGIDAAPLQGSDGAVDHGLLRARSKKDADV